MKKVLCTVGIAVAIAALSQSYAKISLPKIFSDNMVFQCDTPIQVWGKADPKAKIEMRFAGKTAKTTASAKGNWLLKFPQLSASDKPQVAKFFENGKESVEIKNALVGEVWLISGQSNMAFRLSKTEDKAALERATYPNIRHFSQGGASEKLLGNSYKNSKWVECTPQNAADFSAVGFFFAEKLSKDLKVPVALVNASLGGSRMVAWMPSDKISGVEYFTYIDGKYKEAKAAYNYEESLKKWNAKVAKNKAAIAKAKEEGKKAPAAIKSYTKPQTWTPWLTQSTPYCLYNSQIHNMLKFPIRGVLWYQGESDDNGNSLNNFEAQLTGLIGAWRDKFGKKDLPFLFVQLPSMDTYNHRNKKSNWARVRVAQANVAAKVPNTGMAITLDTGTKDDVHPKVKTLVSERLEKIALAKVYGKKSGFVENVAATGAVFNADNTVSIAFNGKLKEDGKGRGFNLKIGKKWCAATARLDGDKVVVSLKKDKSGKLPDGEVDGVRYLWMGWAQPNCWLLNSADVPVSSFFFYKQAKK